MFLRPVILFLLLSLISLRSNGQKFAFVDSEYILGQMEGYQKAQKQIDDLAAEWQKELIMLITSFIINTKIIIRPLQSFT